MPLQGWEWGLIYKEIPGIFPGSLSLIGFIDDFRIDSYLPVVDKLSKLLVEKGDEVLGELTGKINVLEHVLIVSHHSSSIFN